MKFQNQQLKCETLKKRSDLDWEIVTNKFLPGRFISVVSMYVPLFTKVDEQDCYVIKLYFSLSLIESREFVCIEFFK